MLDQLAVSYWSVLQHCPYSGGSMHGAESVLDVKLTRCHAWIGFKFAHNRSRQQKTALVLPEAELPAFQLGRKQRGENSHKRFGIHLLEERRQQNR
eukprot:5426883-Amphidinium_carterae.1